MKLRTKNLFRYMLPAVMAVGLLLPTAIFAAGVVPSIGLFGGIFGNATLAQIIIRLVQFFLAVLGFIAVVLLIYAGYLWMTAAGDPAKVAKAKQVIYGTVIGLIIIFSAFAITAFLFSRFGPPGPPPPEHCSVVGDIRSCNIDGCDGSQQCSGANVWSACYPINFDCAYNPWYGDKFAGIFSFSDVNLPGLQARATWNVKYPPTSVLLPKSSSLQIHAFAHNTADYGQIKGLNLWEVLAGGNSSTATFAIASSGVETLPNKTYYYAWAGAAWDSSTTYSNATGTTLHISVDDNTQNDYQSKNLKVRFYPAHCFDNVKDNGETDIDCGGECGNCDGQSCKQSGNNICEQTNCASNICGADCLCVAQPTITYIDPAVDAQGDTDRFNLIPSQTDDDVANGAPGNYITIFGRHFGPATGTVTFTASSGINQTPATVALCAKSWSNNQIVAVVPDGLSSVTLVVARSSDILRANPLTNYQVVVTVASSTLSSNGWNFQVNNVSRPGICQAEPDHGVFPATTTIAGWNFPTTNTQQVVWQIDSFNPLQNKYIPIDATSTLSGAWTDHSVVDIAPENKTGRSGIRIYNGDVYSNFFNFLLSNGNVGDPCGYDSTACEEDLSTCDGSVDLACQFCSADPSRPNYQANCDTAKNCTCQQKNTEVCVYNSDPALNDKRSCSTGGCSGLEYCSNKNVWSRSCQFSNPSCLPFLGNQSGISEFSWAFSAKKKPIPGMSCSSDIWSDGTCDINGCIDPQLACDTGSSTEEWLELFNGSSTPINFSNNNLWLDASDPFGAPTVHYKLSYLASGNKVYDSYGGYAVASGVSKINDSADGLGWALKFDGVAGHGIALPANKFNQAPQEGTISVWVKPAEVSKVGHIFWIGTAGGDANGFSGEPEMHLSIRNQHFEFHLYKDASANGGIAVSGQTVAPDNWYYLTAVYKTHQAVALYVNGQKVTSAIDPLTINSVLPNWDLAFLGRSLNVGINNTSDSRVFNGDIKDFKFFNRALTDSEVQELYGRRVSSQPFYLLENSSFAAGEFKRYDTANLNDYSNADSAVSGRQLSNEDRLAIIDANGAVKDAVAYGPATGEVAPAFAPGSFGRKTDGLTSGKPSDFVYFPNSTPGSANNPTVAPAKNFVINEVSLAHQACTCVPKSQLCLPGKVDATACPMLGQCKQVRTCNQSGHFGSCVQANLACIPYPLVPASTIASYSWSFGANNIPPPAGPMVISACDDSADCSQNRLPSPSPWSDVWNVSLHPNLGIQNDKACLNAVIYARFTQTMDSASLNTDNIRLFAFNSASTTWIDKTADYVAGIESRLSSGDQGKDSFVINLSRRLDSDANYRVFLNKKVRNELGQNLIDDPNGVNQSLCSLNTAVGLPSEPGVCWSFTTRSESDPGKICQIGCVNCGPNKYFNRYYGQEKLHVVDPISIDNSCIILNNNDYGWNWSEQEQKPGGAIANAPNGWSLQKIFSVAYSWLTKPLADSTGIASQQANTVATGHGTTTAYQESKWRTNVDTKDWFASDDFDFFQINGQEQVTKNSGACDAHNNFTDPIVIENQYCSRTSSTTNAEYGKQILQSPSPWKGQTDACINGVIFALFSRNMLDSSLLSSSGEVKTVKNIDVYLCSEAAAATSSAFAVNTAKCRLQNNWQGDIFNYTNQNITMADLINAGPAVQDSVNTEGIRIIPPGGTKMEANSWYRIVIKGGYDGVRGASSTAIGQESAEGILQVPSVNARLTDAIGYPWYYWYFKTGPIDCPIDQIAVLPQLKFMATVGETQGYTADPYAANCNHLNPYLYIWKWDSLVNSYTDRCASANPTSGDYVATICDKASDTCSTATEPNWPMVKAFSHNEGDTKITAAAVQGECVSNKFGAGDLQVGNPEFKVTSQSNTNCLNPDIYINFSQDAIRTSLSGNITLYRCADGDTACATVSASDQIGLNILTPQESTPSANRVYAVPVSILTAGETYRVVVRGGSAGVISTANLQLKDLNFSLNQANAFDSYSWTFSLLANTKVCRIIDFGLNPCPNGVWSVTADAGVSNLAIKFYKGVSSQINGDCISDAQMQKIGFWRRIFNEFVRLIRSFLGFRSVAAANWWCPINSADDGQFLAGDLAKMRLGNYERSLSLDSISVNAKVLAFTDDGNNYKINFIRNGNWDLGTQYKATASYERNGVLGTASASTVTTYDQSCKMNDVRFDIWPRGDAKASDAFFCASDPASGKPDDCGRLSSDLYDDDMSAPWTMAQAGNGYNLSGNGTAQTAVTSDYRPGNNHLYRLWPLDIHGFTLRGTDFSAVLNNINTETVYSAVTSTDYAGDFWLTSGFKPGRSMFNASISDSFDSSAASSTGSLLIYTFFCNNPWPNPKNFPFIDSTVNCQAGTGQCINTNFGTYYCRDAGLPETIADDLPSIAVYDAQNQNFSSGAGVVKGNGGETCASLPANFTIKVAYYNSVDGRVYLWGADGSVYSGSYATGWLRVDKGAWEKKGLPAKFSPVVGYTFRNNMYLWDSGGRYLVWDGQNWKTTSIGNLPANFHPTVGYVFRDSSGSDKQIELWDAGGMYKTSDVNGTNWKDDVKPSLNFRPIMGYSDSNNTNIQVWDSAGNYKVKNISAVWTDGIKSGLPVNFRPSLGFYDGATINLQQADKAFRLAGSWQSVATSDKTCDNKVKEFLFAGLASSTDAIGLRIYDNNNHYSPTLWYKSRFNPSLQGSLAKLNIDGYSAAQEGRTVYVDAADFNDNRSSVYSDMYLMSYNEGAGKVAQNIYAQLLSNWFFNAGSADQGGLEFNGALGYCSVGGAISNNMCFSDADCLKRNAGYCKSDRSDAGYNADKAKITRDTQRLADVQDIYTALAGYYGKLRCSNDSSRACNTNADCLGGAFCGNFYPALEAGTYISNKTFSVWPSWQDNLAKELGVQLPVDPINQFKAWNGSKSVDCSDPFNAVTCWDQISKTMTHSTTSPCNLDYDSAVYAYQSARNGVSAKIYAKGEEFPTGANWQPAWHYVANLAFNNPFDNYNSQIRDNQFCQAINPTCGNGRPDAGETCSTCPLDIGCPSGQSCQNTNGAWNCQAVTLSPINPVRLVCGNGIIDAGEQCEFANGTPTCGTATVGGALCCTDQCQFSAWYLSANRNPVCGDGIKTDQEQCDCGSGGTYSWSVLLGDTTLYNPFTCTAQNGPAPTIYSTIPQDKPYCDTSCRLHDHGNVLYCGDGIVSSPYEKCDKLNDVNCNDICTGPKDTNGGCDNDCCWKPNDNNCQSACGETHTANTCDDCKVCDPAKSACCSKDKCEAITSAAGNDGVTYCNNAGQPGSCQANWTLQGGFCTLDCNDSANWACTVGICGGCPRIQAAKKIGPAYTFSQCAAQEYLHTCNDFDCSAAAGDGCCEAAKGEDFNSESACAINYGTVFALRNQSSNNRIIYRDGSLKMNFYGDPSQIPGDNAKVIIKDAYGNTPNQPIKFGDTVLVTFYEGGIAHIAGACDVFLSNDQWQDNANTCFLGSWKIAFIIRQPDGAASGEPLTAGSNFVLYSPDLQSYIKQGGTYLYVSGSLGGAAIFSVSTHP